MSAALTSRRRVHRRRGFSLVELMVVIVIIGLLTTLVVPNVLKRLSTSQWAAVESDLTTIHQSLAGYALDHSGRYPLDIEALVTPDESGHAYLDRRTVPRDPWGAPYLYEPPSGAESRPRVYTLGKDGAAGGDGDDRDLSNLDVLDGEG